MLEANWDLDHLAAIETRIWRALAEGVHAPGSLFRTPVLATIRGDGPQARVVVLRRADRTALMLQGHTDRRSKKLKDLQDNPNVSWHFYDPEEHVQLCVQAQATVHA